MPPKKAKTVNTDKPKKLSETLAGINPTELAIKSLKLRWLDISLKENYLHSQKITEELDNLEKAIGELELSETNKEANKQ